jgi:WXG100 family type VII secretion target
MTFKVTAAELNECANKLTAALQQFDDATKKSSAAAYQLMSQWEGDAAHAFSDEQTKSTGWFNKMSQIVETYIAALKAAAAAYLAFDIAAKGIIG